MTSFRWLFLPSLGALLLGGAPAPLAAQTLTVGPNVRVSVDRSTLMHSELMLGADRADARRLVACSHLFDTAENEIRTVNYLSTDRGKSWRLVREVDGGRQAGDPVCGFGVNGTLYAIALVSPTETSDSFVVSQSSDLGRTWSSVTLPWIDREYLTVDQTGGRYHGRVYLHGTGFLRPFDGTGTIDGSRSVSALAVTSSSDSGRTFRDWLKLPSVDKHWILGMGNGVVLSSGRFGVLFGELREFKPRAPGDLTPNAWLKFAASDSGGTVFEPAVVVADWTWCGRNASIIPYLAVDESRGPFRDRLYAVWPEGSTGRCNIALAHSSDGGRTWSAPVVVNDDARRNGTDTGPDHFMPTVAVNKDGVVGVAWYDRRDDSTNVAWKLRFAASIDGGETFTPSVAVSEAAFAPSWGSTRITNAWVSGGGQPSRTGGSAAPDQPAAPLTVQIGAQELSGGDTGGLVAGADGVFHTLWIDNRTGVDQIWTAPVTVQGAAVRHGAPELADLADVTGQVTLELRNTRYDPATRTVSLDAALRNTSRDTLRAPLKVRAIGLRSGFGTVRARGADAGSERHPVWDFSKVLSGGVLAPGQMTSSRRLTFVLTELRALRADPRPGTSPYLINLEARVLAPARGTPSATVTAAGAGN
ncbi:MAG TPA: sialidase family protein [Gemmatimonadales bacterium]|nr:sialidase family protein [Gemmatimonadales bacterium]